MSYLAREVMNTKVITVPSTMDVRDAARLFLENGITGAPVTDDRGELAGVISQTDLIYYNLTRDDELVMDSAFYHTARVEGRHIPAGFQIEDCNTCSVGEVMTPVVHSVTENASLDSVARLMTRKHIHRVIVRRGRKVAGIISALDVLRVGNRNKAGARSRTKATKTAKTTRPAKRKAATSRRKRGARTGAAR